MWRFQHGMVAWMVWSALTLTGFGQALPEWLSKNGAPKPPDFGVRDENGVFNRNAGAMKRISDQIRKLEADHSFQIYLLVEPVLIATNAPELAAQLQQAWLPEGTGLVVVFESDSRRLGFGRDLEGGVDTAYPDNRLPTHEAAAIVSRATAATDSSLAPQAYVEALIDNLTKECHSYFEKQKAPLPGGRSLRMALLTIGALALLGLAAIVVGALVRLPSMSVAETFRFPVVDRPERLGASCGGGNVTSRRFKAGANG